MKAPVSLALAAGCTMVALSASAETGPAVTPRPNWSFPSQTASAASSRAAIPQLNPAQMAAPAADRAKLLDGVKTLPRIGAPGPVVAYGAPAFPLAAARDGKSVEAVAAAATWGKGRVVIFGQNGYLNGGQGGDLDRLLLNAVQWCSGKETPRVGLRGSKLSDALSKAGLQAHELGKISEAALATFDVAVINAQNLTDPEEADALQRFIAGGGGMIAGMTGWAFGISNGGKDFATDFQGNRMLAPAGLAFTAETLAAGTPEAVTGPEPMLNAFSAIAALQAMPGGPPPPPDTVKNGTRTIQLALTYMPSESKPLFQHLIATTLASLPAAPVPTPERPLVAGIAEEARARVALQARLSRFLAPSEVKANPAAEKFPGQLSPDARPVTKTISIDATIPEWHSTGLYAGPGATITVKFPPECAGQGYGLRIGCHTDQLYNLEKWNRTPEITVTAPLSTAETALANPFGGLIYITVPARAKQSQPFQVSIAGGVESPLFVLGRTSDAEWQQMCQSHAPWAELACKGVIITVPSEVARDIQKPTELMQFWQSVVDAEDDLAGTAARRRRPERIVPDVQISAGFMHSGYPIMIHLPQAREMVTLEHGKFPGWGFYHELGHNHQDPAWTFPGTVEVTCNLFSLYIIQAVQHQPMRSGHSAVSVESQQKMRARYFAAGARFEQWQADPFLALGIYIQLIEGFGFDTLKDVLCSYQGNEFGPPPKSDLEKHDQWMVRYSKITGKNLGPLFETWGIPVSTAARAEIATLPQWIPADLK